MTTPKPIDDGGPAFPLPEKLYEHSEIPAFGLSLRDYFAAKAMQGFLAANKEAGCNENAKHVAFCAYYHADEMIRARKELASE